MATATKPVDWIPDDGVPVCVGDVVYAIHDGEPWTVQRHGLREVGGSQVLRWIDIPEQYVTFVASQHEAKRRHEVLSLSAYIVKTEERLAAARARLEALAIEGD